MIWVGLITSPKVYLMLLPATVVLYCIGLSMVTDMLYIYYCRRLATRLYFSHHVVLLIDGIDHLIKLLTRIVLCLSRSLSWFACRSSSLLAVLPSLTRRVFISSSLLFCIEILRFASHLAANETRSIPSTKIEEALGFEVPTLGAVSRDDNRYATTPPDIT